MKVCMLASGHDPRDDRIFHREAKSLSGIGYDVSVIAPGDVRAAFREDGVKIFPVRPFKRGLVRRVGIVWDLLRKGLDLRADVYHCHEPESLSVGVILKVLTRAKVVYDVHEHWPSLISARFHGPLREVVFLFVKVLEDLAAEGADAVISVSGSLRAGAEVVHNCPPLRSFTPLRKGPPGRLVVYEGGISPDRGLSVFLEALLRVRDAFPDVIFKVVGDLRGEDEGWVREFVEKHNIKANFEITGWLPYSEVPERLMEADIGVILFQPVLYNNIVGAPNKLFEYMAAGLPVVAPDFPEMGRVVREVGCGVLVDPTDPEAVARAVTGLLSDPEEARRMGEQGRKAVEERYCWERMEGRLAKVYASL